jgi:hypothetical protein
MWLAAAASVLAQGAEGSGPELFAQGKRANEATRPTPRWPDGRVNLGAVPGETGLWLPIDAPRYDKNLKHSAVPFQPWART